MAAIAIPAEPEIAVRQGVGLVPRLARRSAETSPATILPADYRLTPAGSGAIDGLSFTSGHRDLPAPGQVEIRVAASGVNFKDILNVLGMYPGDPGPLGSECAGVVTAVGEGVSLAPGTAVVAVAGHAYGRHMLADARLVAPLPDGLSFAEGASLPIACLTAHFALHHLARIGPDDRVLIHAAAGGVGMAACALAQRAGAEVFATAGTEEKRALLRSQGIAHVFDSRSSSFADAIMQATDGRGVTVVLNSLADELIGPSFDVLAPGGRFLEIGKRGIWSHERVAALGRDVEYHVIDWGETFRENPALIGEVFREVIELVARGELAALPITRFRVERIADAFRYMAAGRHTGKIVLTHPVLAAEGPLTFDAQRSYLITGGTAGLGLETAIWAASRGARTIVLAARHEPAGDVLGEIDALRSQGVAVHVRRCDVGAPDDVAELTTWIAETLPPLGGIIHAAGTLADRTLQHATWENFEAVLRTKAHGPALLAAAAKAPAGTARDGEAAAAMAAPFFIAYSSIASVFGSPGQGNHAAANAFLDVFAATRWRDDAIGMSIAWGPWSETGSATDEATLERTRTIGLKAFTTHDGLERLGQAFDRPRPHVVAMDIADPAALRAKRPGPLLEMLDARTATAAGTSAGATHTPEPTTLSALLAATPADARRNVLLRRLRERVRTVLGLPDHAALDPARPLGEMGLDSLLAVELRNALCADAERRLPATLLFDHPTVAALTDHLLALLAPQPQPKVSDTTTVAGSTPAGAAHPLAAVESLSDDDVDRLLAEKLVRHG